MINTDRLENVMMLMCSIYFYTNHRWISGSICLILIAIANWPLTKKV